MRSVVNDEKSEIKSYKRNLTLNLQHNLKILNKLKISPHDTSLWNDKIEELSEIRKSLGN